MPGPALVLVSRRGGHPRGVECAAKRAAGPARLLWSSVSLATVALVPAGWALLPPAGVRRAAWPLPRRHLLDPRGVLLRARAGRTARETSRSSTPLRRVSAWRWCGGGLRGVPARRAARRGSARWGWAGGGRDRGQSACGPPAGAALAYERGDRLGRRHRALHLRLLGGGQGRSRPPSPGAVYRDPGRRDVPARCSPAAWRARGRRWRSSGGRTGAPFWRLDPEPHQLSAGAVRVRLSKAGYAVAGGARALDRALRGDRPAVARRAPGGPPARRRRPRARGCRSAWRWRARRGWRG